MFHILGFLFFFILIIIVIGLLLLTRVIRGILGVGRRMTGNHSGSTRTQTRGYTSDYATENKAQHQESSQQPSGKKKVFGSDEGEYVDFEEIKE